MKHFLLLIFSFSIANAATGKNENKKIDITPHAITWIDNFDTQFAYVPGLEDGLFKTLKIQPTHGPLWQGKAIDFLESQHDFHETSSYWYDRHSEPCGLSEEELESAVVGYDFKIVAVKPLKGSKRSLMYFVQYFTILDAKVTCELLENEYVFLNQLDKEGQPVYLGERADQPPKF